MFSIYLILVLFVNVTRTFLSVPKLYRHKCLYYDEI